MISSLISPFENVITPLSCQHQSPRRRSRGTALQLEVRQLDWDDGLEEVLSHLDGPGLLLGAELLWADDAVEALLEAVVPAVVDHDWIFVYGAALRPSNDIFMRRLAAIAGTSLSCHGAVIETRKMGLLLGWLVGRVAAFLCGFLSAKLGTPVNIDSTIMQVILCAPEKFVSPPCHSATLRLQSCSKNDLATCHRKPEEEVPWRTL
eukprot:s384_g28.t1